MASTAVNNGIPKVYSGERQTNQHRDKSPHSFDSNAQLLQEPHQPMYRKRETKPGQKDKRVLKKTPNSPSSRKKHGVNSKNQNSAPKTDNANVKQSSSNKTNQNKNNSKKKTKKQNNKAKKKKSKLAFWFCMSSNTDDKDRSSQAPRSQPPNPKPSIEHRQESLDREITLQTPFEILATKHSRRNASKRHSAPASPEWSQIVTKAIVESPEQRPRSRTPTGGVRYRFDGTLERPYVYPGGLTFQSGDKSWRRDAKRMNEQANSSFCDTTLEDASQLAQCDKYDDFDTTSKFYLRFDYDPAADIPYSRDRRMSEPSDSTTGEHNQMDQKLHSPVPKPTSNNSFACSNSEDNYVQDKNVIYDIPYEGDSEKESDNEVDHDDTDGKRNSYYSKPLQNSGCIYMWHSCEDLQHCEEKYHSTDRSKRICEICKGSTPPRCHRDNHTGHDDCGDHISVSSSPITPSSPIENITSYARKLSLPENVPVQYPVSDSTSGPLTSGQQLTLTLENTHRKGDLREEVVATDVMLVEEGPKLAGQREQSNSPFRRDIGRSSCMPGNKRFFLPPPPCYTPPKEEMEATLTTISKVSCHRGSQTDLTSDVDIVDMEDRDHSLKRQDTLHQEDMNSEKTNRSSNATTQKPRGTEKHPIGDQCKTLETQNKTTKSDVASKQSTNKQSSPTKFEPNQNTKPVPNVRTSTPKPSRRLSQQDGDLKVFSGPKPLPRKRIPSKDANSPVSAPEVDVFGSTKMDSGYQKDDSLTKQVEVRTNKVTPVPKKRRSQMIEADLTYTSADIEKVLADCKGHTLPHRSSVKTNGPNINDNDHCRGSSNTGCIDDTKTADKTISGIGENLSKPLTWQTQSTPCKEQLKASINTSPERRCRLNSSLGSSIDGGYPSRKFTALSPSLDNMVDRFQEMTHDPDNEDNCNADDEMSIHNEDTFPAESTPIVSCNQKEAPKIAGPEMPQSASVFSRHR